MENNELLKQVMSFYIDNATFWCNQTVLSQPAPDDGLYCPPLVDGWGICFNYTKAGTNGYGPCPKVMFSNNEALAFRHCEANGTWQIFPSGESWTNLTGCAQHKFPISENYHQSVGYIYLLMTGTSLSLILLIISLAIFFGFRQLRCDRITIHKNLFISYVLSALTWIIVYKEVVLNGPVLLDNPTWCQLLHVLSQAFTVSNYSWMFCEGVYLHMIMVHALRSGKKLIKCLVIGGWVSPFVLTAIYGIVRWATNEGNHSCWIHETALMWITGVPILASVIINICILVNVVRLLMTKLQQIPDAPQNRTAAKATLILVPLFGLQFILFPARPEMDSFIYPFYLYTMAVLQSTQGTIVSIIFCFCNGEVRSIIRRKWHQHKLMYEGGKKTTGVTSSTFVDGYSMVDTTREGTSLRSKATQDNHYKYIESSEIKDSPAATTPLVKKDNFADITNNHVDDPA